MSTRAHEALRVMLGDECMYKRRLIRLLISEFAAYVSTWFMNHIGIHVAWFPITALLIRVE